MPVAARLALFAVLLVVAFGGAALLGGAVDPEGAEAGEAGHADAGAQHGGAPAHGKAAEAHTAPAAASDVLPGLAAEQDGLRLELARTRFAADGAAALGLRILDRAGRPVRAFDVEHTKRLHLVVVRRDLRGFQHVHPTMAADGTWSVPVDLSRPGTHRVYADFSTGGKKRTLGTDVHVDGPFRAAAEAPVATVSRDGDLEVRLRRDGARVSFDVLRAGRLVNDQLQELLGAKGHLVTLRAVDLAYLHTHPDGDRLAFETELPSAGTYRLWVQFQLDGRVRTVAFTQEVTR
jgi:hypothetical protein